MTTDNNHNPQPDENDDLDVDLSQLEEGRSNRKRILSIIAGAVIILILVVAVPLFVYFLNSSGSKETVKTRPDESLQASQKEDNSIAAMQKRIETEKAERAQALQAQMEAEQRQRDELERQKREAEERKAALERALRDQQTAQQQSSGQSGSSQDKPVSPSARKLMGGVMVNVGGESANGAETGKDGGSNNGLNAMLQTEDFAPSVAGVQTIDPRYLLSRGTQIPCVLKTKIVTDYKGVVLCQITKDIYSDDNSTLLVRRASMAFGQITQAVTNGASRVFINWSGIDTSDPERVRIRVDALGTDPLGAAGAPAWMDTHFWERFGNTLKLMTFSDLLETGKNAASKSSGTNNGYISYDNTTDGIQDLANTSLEHEIDIPSTAYINQGTLMNIFVPRDLDFSSVIHNQ